MMDDSKSPGTRDPAKVEYATPIRGRLRFMDWISHIIGAVGTALVLGGFAGLFNSQSWILFYYSPHLVALGGFVTALFVSLRLSGIVR